MSNSGHLQLRVPSSTSGTKRKSESLQKHNAPSIQSWCASSKENLCPNNKEKRTRKKRKKAETAANGVANPVELSANTFKGFVQMDAIHYLDAFLNQLLPLQDPLCISHDSVQLDQHVVSAKVRVNDAGNANSPLCEVVASERVATATNSQLNIGPQAREEPYLTWDPLQIELGKIQKEIEELQKSYQDKMSGLKSECEKETKELVAVARKKYELKLEDAEAQFRLKKNGANQNFQKTMNKLLADAYSSNCMNMRPTWPLMQQGFPSNSMQYHQHLVRPAPNLQQISSVPHPNWFNPTNSHQNPSFQNSKVHPLNPDIRPNYVPSSNMLQPQNIPTSNSQQNPSFQNFKAHPQNPDIRPNHVPSSNTPQLHNLPVNQMSSLVAPYGFYPQGNHQFAFMPIYPQGHHQFSLMPSYPYGYLPQGYPFPPHCSPQGLKNFNPAADPNSDKGKKTRISEAETSTSSPNSKSSADNNAG